MRKHSRAYSVYELLSSMRFAVTLLVVIALASIIGTIIKQNESYTGYLVEFGPFWFEIFKRLGFYNIYSAGWFLGIMAFLVLSTGLCIYRHTPQFLKEMRSYRENATLNSLSLFKHQQSFDVSNSANTQEKLQSFLSKHNYRFKEKQNDGHLLLAGKKGTFQKLGYFFAHAAIILICVGGLADGNLFIRAQEWFNGKHVEKRDLRVSEIPESSKLPTSNPTFRGNVTIPEGSSTDVLFLNHKDGYFVQELPFLVTLKKFHVEHYPTGQPKKFASDIVVTMKDSGKVINGTTSVNHPVIVDGIAIYQASFGDGGSPVSLKSWNLASPSEEASAVEGVSQSTKQLALAGKPASLELGDFRFFNIENFDRTEDKAKQDFVDRFKGDMQDAAKVTKPKTLHNVGPSITFKWRDATGQAIEYINYMQPVTLEGAPYFISGMKTRVQDPYRYFRFPADRNGEITGFMKLRALLLNPEERENLANLTANQALSSSALSETFRVQFVDSAERVLATFAKGGFPALDEQLKASVPQDKRNEVAGIYMKILQTAALEAYKKSSQQQNVSGDEMRFVLDSLVSMSALNDYGTPVYLQLTNFQQIQASGFQIARAPAKNLVYLGCLLLVIGIFAMFYIQEYRVWLVIQKDKVMFAMSGNRKHQQFEQLYQQHLSELQQLLVTPTEKS
ncbi:cytochrome c biogenesis protein ResB [Leeia sp. TBRC 13508]|uniref:Cytochrome c biogenesis protein ResB n=1 Tax=Leeia speluncae TaxID=2884804 RepID=A0ABS8D5F0_9NEIS|nr:cytochrome c biogenesis protein ResB [Leeia speluncae]MCB6183434.1 cytochrome c biogenesis protein ResB [Leeia speluncae]